MISNFRSGDSFPIKTGSLRKGTVDPSLDPGYGMLN